MTSRKKNLVGPLAATVILGCGAAANAGVITETESFSLQADTATFKVINNSSSNPVTSITQSGPKSASSNLTFNQFNTSIGTLLGVSVSFTSSYGAVSTVNVTSGPFDNGTAEDPSFFANGKIDLLLSSSPVGLSATLAPTASASCLITMPDDESPVGRQTCADTESKNGSFDVTFSGLSLLPFQGSGTFDLLAKLTGSVQPAVLPDNGTGFADNSTFDGALDGLWSGSVTVAYTYDPLVTNVPEPWTLYLVVAALAGIAWLPRRKA